MSSYKVSSSLKGRAVLRAIIRTRFGVGMGRPAHLYPLLGPFSLTPSGAAETLAPGAHRPRRSRRRRAHRRPRRRRAGHGAAARPAAGARTGGPAHLAVALRG